MRKLKQQFQKNYGGVENWLLHFHQGHPHFEIESVRKAFKLLEPKEKEAESQGKTKEQILLQKSFGMVDILVDLNVDIHTLMAAIVCGSVRGGFLSLQEIQEVLSPDVRSIVEAVLQMDMLESLHVDTSGKKRLESSVDNFRKMLLAVVDDVRVVLIKLAEQLYVLHQLEGVSKKEQIDIATTAMNIYASLANRLGIGHLKWQIEDMAFRYINPKAYQAISKSLNEARLVRESYVQEMIVSLEALMKRSGLADFNVMGRAKHIYSIFRKMQRKQVDIEGIYDTIALRVLVSTVEDCYTVLGCVHDVWEPLVKEFDDYISHPKPNGYRSVHTAVIGPAGRCVEIQIRTYQMHEESELGVAAHWAYKEGSARQKTACEDKIAWLRQVLDWQKEVGQTDTQSRVVQARVFNERVYVFTPDGDVIDLPQGATPLDFAYCIHSDVGHRCRGAKISNVLVSLTYELKMGDQVEILTAKHGQPSRDWLNASRGYLKTARARKKVVSWFHQQDYEYDLERGKELAEKEFKRLRLKEIDYSLLVQRFKLRSIDEFFVNLGRSDISVHSFVQAIQTQVGRNLKSDPLRLEGITKSSLKNSPQVSSGILIEGVGGLLTAIAKCCKPVYPEPIVGYVTVGRGVTIHRKDCPNLLEKLDLKRERLINVYWGKAGEEVHSVDLFILATDQQDLMQAVTQVFAGASINITGLNSFPDHKRDQVKIFLTIDVSDLEALELLMVRLNKIKGVLEVKRTIH